MINAKCSVQPLQISHVLFYTFEVSNFVSFQINECSMALVMWSYVWTNVCIPILYILVKMIYQFTFIHQIFVVNLPHIQSQTYFTIINEMIYNIHYCRNSGVEVQNRNVERLDFSVDQLPYNKKQDKFTQIHALQTTAHYL